VVHATPFTYFLTKKRRFSASVLLLFHLFDLLPLELLGFGVKLVHYGTKRKNK
jgi:hypothetical protein